MKNERNIDFQATIKVAPTKRRLYSCHRASSVVEMNRRLKGVCNTPLQSHAIINMNGRIYDPITAQFMQADNYIQTPEDYIGYNRYAYCRYNPFKYTDPSGEMLMMKMDNSSSKGSIDEKYLPIPSKYAMEVSVEKIVKILGETILLHGSASDIGGQLKEFLLSDEMKAKYEEMTGLAFTSKGFESFILGALVSKWGWQADGSLGIVDYGVKFTQVTLTTRKEGTVDNTDIQNALNASNISREDVFIMLHTHEQEKGFSRGDLTSLVENTYEGDCTINLFRDGSIYGIVTSKNVEVLLVTDMTKFNSFMVDVRNELSGYNKPYPNCDVIPAFEYINKIDSEKHLKITKNILI
ncbi:MAG: RHS repeat-associated core domain-containing protein [bacterium]